MLNPSVYEYADDEAFNPRPWFCRALHPTMAALLRYYKVYCYTVLIELSLLALKLLT